MSIIEAAHIMRLDQLAEDGYREQVERDVREAWARSLLAVFDAAPGATLVIQAPRWSETPLLNEFVPMVRLTLRAEYDYAVPVETEARDE